MYYFTFCSNNCFTKLNTHYFLSKAFNNAGEGPRSETTFIRTLQGVPGPPSNLTFDEITMTTLRVSWDQPERPNGEIVGYVVAYETATQNESKS